MVPRDRKPPNNTNSKKKYRINFCIILYFIFLKEEARLKLVRTQNREYL